MPVAAIIWTVVVTAGIIAFCFVALIALTVFIEAMAEPEDQFDTFLDKPER